MLELISGNKSFVVGIAFKKDTFNSVLCVVDSKDVDLETINNTKIPELMSEKGLLTVEYQTVEAIDNWIKTLNNIKEYLIAKEAIK